jgi:ubiquinone/menaquinone biosynthesis C-methylase UbiE
LTPVPPLGPAGFDSIAPAYEAWYKTPLGRLVDRLEKEAVFALVEAKAGALALDLSCGTGNYSLALVRRGLRVVGADLSEPMLRLAQARATREGIKLALVRADGTALPFRAGAFDLVTAVLGLEFTGNPGKVIAEACRVLKPGATLVAAILNRAGLWTLWRRLKRRFVHSVWDGAAFLSPGELWRLLEEHGLQQLRWRSAVRFLPLSRARGIRWLERWEAWGARWMPGQATFVVVAGRTGSATLQK